MPPVPVQHKPIEPPYENYPEAHPVPQSRCMRARRVGDGHKNPQQRTAVPDLRLQVPTIAGKVDPEGYLDWECRMDHIFACYAYDEPQKVMYAAAQLVTHALLIVPFVLFWSNLNVVIKAYLSSLR